MSFRKYDIEGNQLGLDVGGHVFEETKTEQSHKEEVDINNIVAKHGADLVKQVSDLSKFVWDDVTNNDFQEMMNQMIKAKETFADVPKEIRRQFGNDPAAFMDFVLDTNNSDQLIAWGLKNAPEPPPETIQVSVVNPPETPSTTEA
jgi:DNA-binding ferritin-like protein (Dps family)